MCARAGLVHALEVVPEQAEFVAERCRQDGYQNLYVAVGGDDCRLPYRDALFDVAVLNLVFEWCASRLKDESHTDGQKRLLRELARVIRPGGTLYLATKNRFALRLLLGGPDEHMCQLRFGSALPRKLAQSVLHFKGCQRPAGMLYSHDELAAMLEGSGFGAIRSFWATPEMRYPTQYIEANVDAIRRARSHGNLVQGEQRLTRLLMPAIPGRLVRHLTPGLAFLAIRQGALPDPKDYVFVPPPVGLGKPACSKNSMH
jgi:SAM-dependent methyltransferase